MPIELSDQEQAILDAACARLGKATHEAEALRVAAEKAAKAVEACTHETRGIFRGLMELSGRNPDAHQVKWDGASASVEEKPPSGDT